MKTEQDIIISAADVAKIKSKLKRAHGHYFADKSITWNVLNFIQCSVWNHRWGRKYDAHEELTRIYKKSLDALIGRNKNLLSYSRKLKDDLSVARQEINRLKQLLNP